MHDPQASASGLVPLGHEMRRQDVRGSLSCATGRDSRSVFAPAQLVGVHAQRVRRQRLQPGVAAAVLDLHKTA